MSAAKATREADLIASIKLANNGYLLMSYMTENDREFARYAAKVGVVAITSGLVHMPSTKPEFFQTPYPTRALQTVHDDCDWEGAILERQENAGMYD